jgi:hypothetical protein
MGHLKTRTAAHIYQCVSAFGHLDDEDFKLGLSLMSALEWNGQGLSSLHCFQELVISGEFTFDDNSTTNLYSFMCALIQVHLPEHRRLVLKEICYSANGPLSNIVAFSLGKNLAA